MRVLQIIDTLEAGGAERVAVNLANALVEEVDGSFLCATRKEGALKSILKQEVQYLFLNRSSTLDIQALVKLHKFVKRNNITHIHAHASSFFITTIIKFLRPKLKLVWHDHYGKSEFLKQRPKTILKMCSRSFNHILSVNSRLKDWSEENLKATSVSYLPNYAELDNQPEITVLKGEAIKRIVCLANLRPQKDHLTLLKAFQQLIGIYNDWSLHLIGQDFRDDYSKAIKAFIVDSALEGKVFAYGSCPDISAILKQCDIGVLSSKSEGLPLALIEYGLAELPVVATRVGDCHLVISNEKEGQLVKPQDVLELKKALENYINHPEKAKLAGEFLKLNVLKNFSKSATIHKIIRIYKSI